MDVTVSGFSTPAAGAVSARLYISAGEGDAVLTGDQCLFGPDAAGLVNLSGPRNPAQNFFASQICDGQGQLDTSGTFGTRNADPAAADPTAGGGRACAGGCSSAAGGAGNYSESFRPGNRLQPGAGGSRRPHCRMPPPFTAAGQAQPSIQRAACGHDVFLAFAGEKVYTGKAGGRKKT